MGEKVWGDWVLVRSYKTEDSAESEIERRRDHIHEKNSMSDYGILAVKWEKRHELMLPADSEDKLQTMAVDNHVQPDYSSARDRTFNKLKIGKQSAAGKAIDTFIKEVQRK